MQFPAPPFWVAETDSVREVKIVKSCSAVDCITRCEISFYRFPTDKSRRARWTSAVNRKNWEPIEHTWLCARHFVSGKKSDDPLSPDYVPSYIREQPSERASDLTASTTGGIRSKLAWRVCRLVDIRIKLSHPCWCWASLWYWYRQHWRCTTSCMWSWSADWPDNGFTRQTRKWMLSSEGWEFSLNQFIKRSLLKAVWREMRI